MVLLKWERRILFSFKHTRGIRGSCETQQPRNHISLGLGVGKECKYIEKESFWYMYSPFYLLAVTPSFCCVLRVAPKFIWNIKFSSQFTGWFGVLSCIRSFTRFKTVLNHVLRSLKSSCCIANECHTGTFYRLACGCIPPGIKKDKSYALPIHRNNRVF